MSITGQVLRLHEALYKRTDGRIGHRMIGVPTLLLRTTGRRSGATRTNGLVYARDGDDHLVVASNGSADRPPAWLHNLERTRAWRFRSAASAGGAPPRSWSRRIPITSACGGSSTRTIAIATARIRSRRRGRYR